MATEPELIQPALPWTWTDAPIKCARGGGFGASLRGTRDQPRRMTALGYHIWLIRFIAFLFSGL